MRELEFLYKSKTGETNINYLYDKSEKILLPIQTYDEDNASIYSTIKSMLYITKTCIKHLEIYHFQDETFYTYLSLNNQNGKTYKINCDVNKSIELAEILEIPLYIKESILKKQGIKITPDLINQNLLSQ